MRFVESLIGSDNGYNSLGHRCKELSDLNLDNYILFAGCSHTLGEGLEIEKTFPYLIAKHLKCDYYNLGLSGAGIDVVVYNLTQWFLTVATRPKLLVAQLPDYTRFSSILDHTENIIPRGNWDINSQKYIVDGVDNGFLNARKIMSLRIIKNLPTTIITFTHGNTIPYEKDAIRMRHLDYANDNVHSGTRSHEEFASIILDNILDKY